ncbi:hypothetical protein C7999DRAFT_28090 [Corynascus novoguineensis]|uniref:Uncharacterized protein n=1 Tax=Corynascus novoguineensis TaxID=1126955 RepID=A0AAN7HU30_9PEZI|nr:hypothetical protein C7999DRAFT_28090 [Corynascus novoguineensis]
MSSQFMSSLFRFKAKPPPKETAFAGSRAEKLKPPDEIHKDLSDEVDQAFANVDLALRTARGKGWCQVYKINLYLTVVNEEAVGALVRKLKKWIPTTSLS